MAEMNEKHIEFNKTKEESILSYRGQSIFF